jgi:hypothetical protein
MLADKGWTNTYLAGDAFAAQLAKDDRSHRRGPQGHRSGEMSEGFPSERRPPWAALSSRPGLRALPS